MRSVSVKELQNDLSRYLDEARAGQEVLIKERNKPIVKLVPLSANGHPAAQESKPVKKTRAKTQLKQPASKKKRDYLTAKELAAHEAKLVAEGRMSLGSGSLPPEFWDDWPTDDVPARDLVSLVSEDRDED